ncbi:right-handed parallel beta-helix repeat-containing protein [Lentzea sp. JNUCC 0626]|uniref:right-handed parallel beta-helix repeat-containing protein n=1 Tax=Lentzea sp. JNUCC 0626 TaxID=3367513 RepID=UPI003748AF95
MPILFFAGATTAQAQADPQCGDKITTSVTLTADLTCADVGLVIAADRVVLNLGGHTLSGKIALKAENVARAVVRNGGISGDRISGLTLTGTRTTTFDNVALYTGIDAKDARDTAFQRVQQTNRSSEMTFAQDTTVRFQDSLVEAHRFSCATRSDCRLTQTRTSIADNFASGADAPITVVGGRVAATWIWGGRWSFTGAEVSSSFVRTASISLTDSVTSGFVLETTSATFLRNQVGGKGLLIGKITNGSFRMNTFKNGQAVGLIVNVTTPARLTFEGNSFAGNGHTSDLTDRSGNLVKDGLHVHVGTGSDVLIKANRAEGNAQYGIWAQPGIATDGGRNTSTNDPLGCFGVTCP